MKYLRRQVTFRAASNMKDLNKSSAIKISLVVFSLLVYTFIFTYRLDTFPPVWWDEGWTLAVARNWVEFGHYGQMLLGEPRGPGLSAAFPVVAPVALSFKLFGVGIWQGRLPGLFFTLGAIVFMVYLANILYNRKAAMGTFIVLFFSQGHETLNPILVGRQVLGEMPLMFYLLGGYAFFLLCLKRSTWYIVPAVLFWGIAIKTKAQVLPFWVISLCLPLVFSLLKRWWHESFILLLALVGSWIMGLVVLWAQAVIIGQGTAPSDPLEGLYEVTAFVMDWNVRMVALFSVIYMGFPTLIALLWGGRELFRNFRYPLLPRAQFIIKFAIFSLTTSWLLWYLLLGSEWLRYLFPQLFFGAIYVGMLLSELIGGVNAGIGKVSRIIIINFNKSSRNAIWKTFLLGILVIGFTLSLTTFQKGLLIREDNSLRQLSSFFREQVFSDAVIETYDSELFFLIDQPYHYPPDQAHVEFNRQTLYGEEGGNIYAPTSIDYDYLAVGPFSKKWGVYDDVLASGQLDIEFESDTYQVYRNRSK